MWNPFEKKDPMKAVAGVYHLAETFFPQLVESFNKGEVEDSVFSDISLWKKMLQDKNNHDFRFKEIDARATDFKINPNVKIAYVTWPPVPMITAAECCIFIINKVDHKAVLYVLEGSIKGCMIIRMAPDGRMNTMISVPNDENKFANFLIRVLEVEQVDEERLPLSTIIDDAPIPFDEVREPPLDIQSEFVPEIKETPNDTPFTFDETGTIIEECDDSVSGIVIIPDGVVEISDNVFEYNEEITNVVIPNSVRKIGDNAFSGCSNLNNLIIPESVEYIGKDAFSGYSKITNVYISKSVKFIGKGAFTLNENLLSFAIDADNPNYTYKQGVVYSKDMEKVIYAFSYFIPQVVNLPETIEVICKGAFHRCKEMKEIELPNSLKQIEDDAFSSCESLVEVFVPENVEKIGHMAFAKCEKLSKIYIASKKIEIERNAFYKCNHLVDIHLEAGFLGLNPHIFGRK